MCGPKGGKENGEKNLLRKYPAKKNVGRGRALKQNIYSLIKSWLLLLMLENRYYLIYGHKDMQLCALFSMLRHFIATAIISMCNIRSHGIMNLMRLCRFYCKAFFLRLLLLFG